MSSKAAEPTPERGVGGKERTAGHKEQARRWALLVGIDEYLHWPVLSSCVADAKALRDVLVEHAGFDKERVWLMTTDAPSTFDRPFTAAMIYNRLKQLLQQTHPNDVVLVYFAGHGDYLDGRSYLIPFDAHRKGEHVIPKQGLSTSAIRDLFDDYKMCKARHKVLILDACHSGGERSVGKAMPRGFGRTFEGAKTFVTISSCTEGQTSVEDSSLGHGVFTYNLKEALKGKADRDGNGEVDLMEMYKYVEEETRLYVAAHFNKEQNPKWMGGVVGSFPLAVRASRKPEPARRSQRYRHRASLPPTYRPDGDGSIEMVLIRGAARPFYIAKCEVSQEQYRAYCKGSGVTFPQRRYARSFGVPMIPELPMVNVTQEEAQAFCEYLGLKLPSSLQWQSAAEEVGEIPTRNPSRYALPPFHQRLSKSEGSVVGLADNVGEWVSDKGRCCGGSWNLKPSLELRNVRSPYSDWIGIRPCYVPK